MYIFYYKKPIEIEINIRRQQKQVIDVYVHLLKAKPPSLEKKPTKKALWKILCHGLIFGVLRYIQKFCFKL